MAWIESHDSLREHPKLKKMARLLGVNRAAAIGHLHMLWWWCLAYAQDGDLSRYDAPEIADGADFGGDAQEFITAMIEAGFLERRSSNLHVHDWHDYAGRLIDRRERNRQAMRQAREQAKQATKSPVDNTEQPRDDTCKATVPYPTVPYRTIPTVPKEIMCAPDDAHGVEQLAGITDKAPKSAQNRGYSPEFEAFWRVYPRRVEKRKAYAAWKARLKERLDAELGGERVTTQLLIQVATNYAAECRAKSREPDKIKHPSTFLSAKHPFADYRAQSRPQARNPLEEYLSEPAPGQREEDAP